MRLTTKIGDFEIVQSVPPDDGDGAIYRVSSPQRASLQHLIQAAGIRQEIFGAGTDPEAFHFTAGRRDLFDIMTTLAETIDYASFPPPSPA